MRADCQAPTMSRLYICYRTCIARGSDQAGGWPLAPVRATAWCAISGAPPRWPLQLPHVVGGSASGMQCALREIDSSKRRLPAGDAALVAQCDVIERRLFPKHESLTGQLEREAMKRSQTMVVAVVDGSGAVGYMIVSRTGHIVKLAVAAAAQRNGVGRWLLRWARSRYQTLSLHVDPERHAAVALYRSEGFTAHGQICDYYCDGRHALLMRLDQC